MEMREENNYEEIKTNNFKEFKEFVMNTRDGVALCFENSEDDILFRKKDINNLFNIINSETMLDVDYIGDDCNIFVKKVKAIVELSDSRQVIIEIL